MDYVTMRMMMKMMRAASSLPPDYRCANSGFSAPVPATLQLQYLATATAWLANNWEENPTGYYSAQVCSQGFLPVKAAKL